MTDTKPKREFTPVEAWDQLAVMTIRKHLAPNGFKKIRQGKLEVAMLDYLPKQRVNECSLIAANTVRLFRENVKQRIDAILGELSGWIVEDEKRLAACHFWQVKKKMELRYKIRSLHGQQGSAKRIMNELDTIKPAAPKK